MTEPPKESGRAAEFQAVQFYSDDVALCRLVARFLAEGFAKGDPAVIIATPAHRAEVESDLRRRRGDCTIRTYGEMIN